MITCRYEKQTSQCGNIKEYVNKRIKNAFRMMVTSLYYIEMTYKNENNNI